MFSSRLNRKFNMHKSHYRPNRSQQLCLLLLIQRYQKDEVIVVHHVLEDTPTRLHLQVERRYNNTVTFERITI